MIIHQIKNAGYFCTTYQLHGLLQNCLLNSLLEFAQNTKRQPYPKIYKMGIKLCQCAEVVYKFLLHLLI